MARRRFRKPHQVVESHGRSHQGRRITMAQPVSSMMRNLVKSSRSIVDHSGPTSEPNYQQKLLLILVTIKQCLFLWFPSISPKAPPRTDHQALPFPHNGPASEPNKYKSTRTSSDPHVFSSSHLVHLHIFSSFLSSSHLLHCHIIFTRSHLHIFSSSQLFICSSSHLHIFLSSHLHIFVSSHLHIFSFSHFHIFRSSHSLWPSCSLALLSPIFLFFPCLRGALPTERHETQPLPTK